MPLNTIPSTLFTYPPLHFFLSHLLHLFLKHYFLFIFFSTNYLFSFKLLFFLPPVPFSCFHICASAHSYVYLFLLSSHRQTIFLISEATLSNSLLHYSLIIPTALTLYRRVPQTLDHTIVHLNNASLKIFDSPSKSGYPQCSCMSKNTV